MENKEPISGPKLSSNLEPNIEPNLEPISEPISLSTSVTDSQTSRSSSTANLRRSRSGSRKLTRSKSSFSVAFEKHIKNDHELIATTKTAKQLIKHAFRSKMRLTDRIKIMRQLVRKFTTLVSKDGKFKIALPLDIVDFVKGFTDMV